MTETPPPPAPEAKPAAATETKKYLLDNVALKFVLLLLGYIAPVPVLFMIAQLWLEHMAGPDQRGNAIDLFRNLFGSGDAPRFLLPLALVPSLLLFSILVRGRQARIIALVSLPVVALVAALACTLLLPLGP